ncbi:MAG: hypothetical protein R2784_10610 [Saprospiraceae bacterium]
MSDGLPFLYVGQQLLHSIQLVCSTATDNCGQHLRLQCYSFGTHISLRTITVVYSAEDVNGNFSNYYFDVTVFGHLSSSFSKLSG